MNLSGDRSDNTEPSAEETQERTEPEWDNETSGASQQSEEGLKVEKSAVEVAENPSETLDSWICLPR